MERDKPESGNEERDFVHEDPAMDAALNWLFTLQAAPEDKSLRAEFEAWRQADTAHARAFAEAAGVWELPEMDIVARDFAARAGYMPPAREADVVEFSRPKRRPWPRAAMAVAAAILVAVAIQQYPSLMLRWQADYMTATGVREEIVLPDGSRMVLNTASAVALDFDGPARSVTLLRGEAYFNVVPDASRPFTVSAAYSEAEVRGTAFAVKTESHRDTVVLEHGRVEIARLAERTDTASLEAGERVTATATALSAVSKADPAVSLAWLQGRLAFYDRPFGEVLDEVSRYYGSPIVVANGRLREVRVHGNYRLDDPERAIRSLATAAGASVTRIPGGILILR